MTSIWFDPHAYFKFTSLNLQPNSLPTHCLCCFQFSTHFSKSLRSRYCRLTITPQHPTSARLGHGARRVASKQPRDPDDLINRTKTTLLVGRGVIGTQSPSNCLSNVAIQRWQSWRRYSRHLWVGCRTARDQILQGVPPSEEKVSWPAVGIRGAKRMR